jgi:hypothetical protein
MLPNLYIVGISCKLGVVVTGMGVEPAVFDSDHEMHV